MRFEDLSLGIRQRNPWESIDLGLSMVQTWWREVYAGWFLITLPLFIVLNILLRDNPGLVILIMWWLKPLYDRVLLYIYSRSAFGQPLVIYELIHALPGLIRRTGLFLHLTIFRLDWSRSFRLPVWQLEGLNGKRRSERTNALARRAGGYASWLLIACVHLEAVFQLSVLGIIWMFVPELMFQSLWQHFWNLMSGGQFPYWFYLSSNIIYYIGITLVEPFYVAGGFALYLNRRTWLEGWDIEMTFRKMAARLEKLLRSGSQAAVLVLAVGFMSCIAYTPVATAAQDAKEPLASNRLSPERSTEVINEVMADKDFGGKRTVTEWELDIDFKLDPDTDSSDDSLGWISDLIRSMSRVFEVLLWIGLTFLVLWLIYRLSRGRYSLSSESAEQRELPAVVSGLDITPDSLPDDVIAEARKLWNEGKFREALSLIYRATVSTLVHDYHIELTEGATEGDVLRAARLRLQNQRQDYLELLTGVWQQLAYAHKQPDENRINDIMQYWSEHFGKQSTEQIRVGA